MQAPPESDLATLLAHLIGKVDAQTTELKQLRQDIQVLRSQSVVKDPDDRWVVGIRDAATALADTGISVDNLKAYLNCVFRHRDSKHGEPQEVWEVRNKGTDKQARWEFHVGRCRARINWFKNLPARHQRLILEQVDN